jgi:hypothetical protein
MAKVIRLTETDLTRLVKRVIIEMDSDMPRRKKGILGHKDSWYDEMDRPINPDEFDYDEEIEFGPDDYEDYINHTERDFSNNKWSFGMRGHKKQDMGPGKKYWDRYQQDGPIKLRKKRMTESDLRRIAGKVIMESESPSYHLFVERIDEIQEEMKYKNMTDEELDNIRESLEEAKSDVKKSDDNLTEIEKKRLNRRINSLLTKLKGMYNPHSYEPMRVKPRIGMD